MPPTAHVAPADELQPADLRLLLGAAAGDLLRAVAATAGGQLAAWRPRQVNHQPRRSTVVQYRADMTWPEGATTSETFVAATGDRLPRDGAAIFDDGSTRVAVWRWPTDPFLPGLPDALDPSKVAALLDELGIDGGTLQLRTRSYRPGRRAVIEATGRRGRLFLKVVRPARAEALHHLHRQLAVDLPVPESLGWSDSGVVVLAAKPGVTLREALRSSRHGVPSPEAVAGVLDRLPSDLAAQPARRDLLSSAEHHATVIAATVPEVRDRLDGLVDRLRTADTGDAGPVTAVHGDLYEAQLLVSRGAITGLLDVDTVGAGLRADDLANFCAHLSVLALGSDRAKPIKRYGAALLTYAEQHHHPGDLRRRISAAVVGLATGPFRVQESNWALNTRRRLDLAAEWLDGTERRG
jgi:hypothetical protein